MRPRPRRPWISLACLALVVIWAGVWVTPRPALCAPQKPDPGKSAGSEKKDEPAEDRTPQRSIRMQEVEILGEVEKPKAMFVIPMAPIEYQRTGHGKDFSREILAPINREWIENLESQQGPAGHPE